MDTTLQSFLVDIGSFTGTSSVGDGKGWQITVLDANTVVIGKPKSGYIPEDIPMGIF